MIKEKRISPKEAAGILRQHGYHISQKCIRALCASKKLKRSVKIGGRWYVSPSEVLAVIGE